MDLSTLERMRVAAETVVAAYSNGDPAGLPDALQSVSITLAPIRQMDLGGEVRERFESVSRRVHAVDGHGQSTIASMSDLERIQAGMQVVGLFVAAASEPVE